MGSYPQICHGGGRLGNTIEFARDPARIAQVFARDVKASLLPLDEYLRERDRRRARAAERAAEERRLDELFYSGDISERELERALNRL